LVSTQDTAAPAPDAWFAWRRADRPPLDGRVRLDGPDAAADSDDDDPG